MNDKPRVLLVARDRFRLPLTGIPKRKFDALAAVLEYRMLASAPEHGPVSNGRFRLVRPFRPRFLDGPLFYATLVRRIARELREFDPAVVLAQSPYEAAAALVARRLARSRARILAEVHGDWRASTRSYGSAWRRLLSPIADLIARTAIRRADAVRTVSGYTDELVRALGVVPVGGPPTFSDLEPFLARPLAPLPDRPGAVFVGALEPHKNVDVLIEAWRTVARAVPLATLHVVGEGSRAEAVERFAAELPGAVRWSPRLETPALIEAIDASTALVLPSRSEGFGRVVIEALARGRAVVGARAGAIPELVDEEVSGLIVEPGDPAALAEALIRILDDSALAERLGEGAQRARHRWPATPAEYADNLLAVVEAAQSTARA
jgi:glycosyltransferase involved in cell wall biosynthesis